MSSDNTIFVEIASYRDSQLIPTMLSLIDNAKYAENLNIVVCWQHSPDETVEAFLDAGFDISKIDDSNKSGKFKLIEMNYKKSNIKLINVNHFETQGACWARNLIQQEYNNEKYCMEIDSHMRAIQDWDISMINDLEVARGLSEYAKPVLTGYVNSFDPTNDPAGRVLNAPWKMDFDRFIPEGTVFTIPSSIDDWRQRTTPMRARFYSAHFAFSDGSMAKEVKHDPEMFFHGEEFSKSVRLWTHGYDLFHITSGCYIFHEYTRQYPGVSKIWDDHTTPEKNRKTIKKDWVERNNESHLRNRKLFSQDGENYNPEEFGEYGFGNIRTVRSYEEYTGLDIKKRSVQQCVLDKIEPVLNYKHYDDNTEWESSLTRSNDIRILIHKNNDLDPTIDDYDFWYLGTHDENNQEVFRKDKTEGEVQGLLKNVGEWLDFRCIYLANRIAKTYTVWPHSKSKGWLDKITKDIN